MKKVSPNSDSYTERVRSWAVSKAHGQSSPPYQSSGSSLPISNSPSNTLPPSGSPPHHDTTNIPPFPSADLHGFARDSSKPTANDAADDTAINNPAPGPPSQVEGEGTIVEPKAKKNVVKRFWYTTKSILLSSWINVLLVFVPIGIASKVAHLDPKITFGMNAVAIIPLAGLLSHATESVAKRMGDTIGALMNVTFGNAVELIIFIIALTKNEIRIVQASLLGSILANLLLILGMAFLVGGLRYREQIYNSTVTQMSACLLSLSVMSLLLPTAFHASFNDDNKQSANRKVLQVSRGTSVVLLLVYVMYLLFQLKSHAYMYESTPQHILDEEMAPGPVAAWMDTSSDSSSSSSTSDSDSSGRSNNTAKRFKRVMRVARRRKSSSASKDTAEVLDAVKMSTNGTGSSSPVVLDGTELRELGIDPAEDGDDEKGDGRKSSNGGHSMSKRERKKYRKYREKKARKARRNQRLTEVAEAERARQVGGEKTNLDDLDPDAPRRVDFAVASASNTEAQDTAQVAAAKRPFTLRSITNMRPQLPTAFSQNVFTQPSPALPSAQPSGPIPHVRYGIRRTNSLPDRLNEMIPSTPATRVQSRVLQPDGVLPLGGIAKLPKDEEDEENISRTTAVLVLLISTGLVALCADFLVESISAVVESDAGISEAFIGLIILPVVGNAAEHVTAVWVASKNKMDLAIGVAVGSSIQIALFVTPLIVLLGWCMGKDMSLYFTLFETVSLFVSAFIVNFLVLDGRSNYLEGALLIAGYILISVAAWFYPNVDEQSNLGGNAEANNKMIRDLMGI